MATPSSDPHKLSLALQIRQHLVDELVQGMPALLDQVTVRLTELLDEFTDLREQQLRRDTWTLFKAQKSVWLEAVQRAWQEALKPAAPRKVDLLADGKLELVSTDVVENRILASRIALSMMEVAAGEVNDLRKRIKALESKQDLSAQDVVHPEVLVLVLVEQWGKCGFSAESWQLIAEVVQRHLNGHWKQSYAHCNAELVAQGVSPVLDVAARPSLRPVAVPASPELAAPYTPAASDAHGVPAAAAPAWSVQAPVALHPVGATAGAAPAGLDLGVLERVNQLLAGVLAAQQQLATLPSPSPALLQALREPSPLTQLWPAVDAEAGSVAPAMPPVSMERVVGELRHQSTDLKALAQNDNEKAIIEMVALMFQAILQEDRIPPGIRVWFARLQMPVLRTALAEPDFFNRPDHPARQLIDHMGSCVMGFDASGITSEALEGEIRRVVQVIEQYPDSGDRVYQKVYEEFQAFLRQYLTQKDITQKVVGVAQQVEQKETLVIQCTIELRNQLKALPVRDEIREFLFKVWAEVIALATMRQGAQDAGTLRLKKTAADLIWAASAKPNRADRARVLADLPGLLQALRAGMGSLGMDRSAQDAQIKVISDILADAFMSKTQTIDAAQIQDLSERLAHLEDFFSEDRAEELPLDVQGIEELLEIDASGLEVISSGGVEATPEQLAAVQQLSLGAWFTIDHNGQLAQVQYVWRSEMGHLHLFASVVGRNYLMQSARLAAFLQAGLLLPQVDEALTARATRDALSKIEANPERLLG